LRALCRWAAVCHKRESVHAEIGSRTETIKHMSSEGMTFRQPGILEIVSRIAAHFKPFHERSRAAVRRGRVRYDLRERERSKPVAKGQTGRLRRITVAPIGEGQAPADFHARRKMGAEPWNQQSGETDKRHHTRNLDRPQTKPVLREMLPV